MKLENILQNKWYKFSKYLTASLLVLASIIALVASWYSGQNDVAATVDAVGKHTVTTSLVDSIRIACMVLGFASLILAIVVFTTRNKTILLLSSHILAIVMIAVLIALASVVFVDTNVVEIPKLAAPAKP